MAISQFFNKNHRLPVSLEIPDLKATTQGYLEFKKIYFDQFTADCVEIQKLSAISNLPLIEEMC
ncbi:hypothetical protein, partial [Acidianus infernus]|uniref:hypothetical protein n=1 Tax=Acidianus infernus TaxID=12915 RepID=UPI0035945288